MDYKTILVTLDESKACAPRLDVAVRLAQGYKAHLVGLFVMPLPFVPTFVAAEIPVEVIEAQWKAIRAAADRVEARFKDATSKAGVAAEWRRIEDEFVDPGSVAALHARYADLAIVGQSDPDRAGEGPTLAEDVLFDSGCPVLVVPYAGRFPTVGERPVVAWNASREAARAVHDAMPILAKAKTVTILAANPKKGRGGHGDMPGADIALSLSRHGVRAEAESIYGSDIEVGDMILSRLADKGADMLVMGAYGHSRLRESIFGGVTLKLFREMTVPVLMSH